MKKLCEFTTVKENNDLCVVLECFPHSEIDLISLGCFSGTEKMIRLTKGPSVTCTLFYSSGKTCSWQWGVSGTTLVSDNLRNAGRMVQECIEKDFGIKCLKG